MRKLIAVAAVLAAFAFVWLCTEAPEDSTVRVFNARKIITMEPDQPTATAVAVQNGRILAVGSPSDIRLSLGETPFEIDPRLADKVLVPGFIDPHLHPTLAATILGLDIVSAMEWTTPRGRSQVVRGHAAFLERLRELDRARSGDDDWLLVWGYHRPYHGELSRAELDAVSTRRPILVWQRSVHEMYFNSRGLAVARPRRRGLRRAPPGRLGDRPPLGRRGLLTLGEPMARILASPRRYRRGLAMMSDVIHRGGITTVA